MGPQVYLLRGLPLPSPPVMGMNYPPLPDALSNGGPITRRQHRSRGQDRSPTPRDLVTYNVTNNALRYYDGMIAYRPMIASFKDKVTAAIFQGRYVRRIQRDVQRRALAKLLQIDAAERLGDLAANTGNNLEKLRGDRAGQYSIRVNDRWRICFVWRRGNAHDVDFTDYH